MGRTTALFPLHRGRGRLIEFGGWHLPLQYNDQTALESALHTRRHASIFDVSHMLRTRVYGGAEAVAWLESLLPCNLRSLPTGQSLYTLFTNAGGGIIDDAIISLATGPVWTIVSNAARAAVIRAYLQASRPGGVELEEVQDGVLVAIQGPEAEGVLQKYYPRVASMKFMQTLAIEGIDSPFGKVSISRSGYTGEDGFEVALDAPHGMAMVSTILGENPHVRLAGLAARDILRQEAGLCLYGADLDEHTSPIQAGLKWTLSPARLLSGGFPGFAAIRAQIEQGPRSYRIGLALPSGQPVPRHGALLLNGEGEPVGRVSSGTVSPTLGHPIAMAYLDQGLPSPLPTHVAVRSRPIPCRVCRLPFVPPKYRK